VDPVSLLVTALATGAATGVGETATAAVKDAYGTLKSRVASRFAGNPSHEVWCWPSTRSSPRCGRPR
jgi:hypothetical protein